MHLTLLYFRGCPGKMYKCNVQSIVVYIHTELILLRFFYFWKKYGQLQKPPY